MAPRVLIDISEAIPWDLLLRELCDLDIFPDARASAYISTSSLFVDILLEEGTTDFTSLAVFKFDPTTIVVKVIYEHHSTNRDVSSKLFVRRLTEVIERLRDGYYGEFSAQDRLHMIRG